MANSEKRQLFRAVLRLMVAVGFSVLYSIGGTDGMGGKWIRRFVAPVWLGIGQVIITKGDWRALFQSIALMFTLSLGYGADTFLYKVGRRLFFGFANGLTNITHLFDGNFNKKRFWTLFTIGIVMNPILIAALGVINPISARAEELIIGFLIGLWAIFIVEEKEA